MRFLHTADWQIGKPFQSLEDHAKREALRKQRVDTVCELKALIQSEKLDFVVVCGDLFDSSTPDAATVSALCSAIGSLEVPVYAIPGNHDHGGPGCIWEQAFFLRERDRFAKGESNQPGHVCAVKIGNSGNAPTVTPHRTGTIGWHCPAPFHITGDADLDTLETQLEERLGQQTNRDLLKLNVHGTLSFTGIERFEKLTESLRARLIRLDLDQDLQVEPSDEELNALTARQDPLIAQVARQLVDDLDTDPLARDALRELQLQTRKVAG